MQFAPKRWHPGLVLTLIVVLGVAPLLWLREAKFEGADSEAVAAIQTEHPQYQPWFKPIAEPASGEIASLLFALQAGIGAGLLGYIMGLYRGRQEAEKPQVFSESGSSESLTDSTHDR